MQSREIEQELESLSEESRQELMRKMSESVGKRVGRSAIRVVSREEVAAPVRSQHEPKSYSPNTSSESREAKRRRRQMEKRNVG